MDVRDTIRLKDPVAATAVVGLLGVAVPAASCELVLVSCVTLYPVVTKLPEFVAVAPPFATVIPTIDGGGGRTCVAAAAATDATELMEKIGIFGRIKSIEWACSRE